VIIFYHLDDGTGNFKNVLLIAKKEKISIISDAKMIKSFMPLKYIFVKLTLTLLAARSLVINTMKNI